MIEKNKAASMAHGYDVWDYRCDNCGERVDCNSRFDKKPDVNFCPNCGTKYEGEK